MLVMIEKGKKGRKEKEKEGVSNKETPEKKLRERKKEGERR